MKDGGQPANPLANCLGKAGPPDEGELIKAFRALDQTGNGFIHAPGVRFHFCEKLTDEEVDKMGWDVVDDDGQINFEGFIKLMTGKGNPWSDENNPVAEW